MKILSVADIHGYQYRLNIVLDNIDKYEPDLVILCGDITQFGPKHVAKNFLDQIQTETFAIPGNIDTQEVLTGINESKAINMHLKFIKKNNFQFIGIGGGQPLLLNSGIENLLDKINRPIEGYIDNKTIIITHVPPLGIQDRTFFGIHSGSKELFEIIDNYKPLLVLCGHIHENPGFSKINETFVINCSMGKKGEGALINIDKNVKIKMLD
jgi:Icc-related predicted phosphoesterase